jgi:hypothetical protein
MGDPTNVYVWADLVPYTSVFPVRCHQPHNLTRAMHLGQILSIMEMHDEPQIQKMCLVDLPPEILDHVFRHATIRQGRLLSLTCRRLNEIGRRYIFRVRPFLSLAVKQLLNPSLFCLESTIDLRPAGTQGSRRLCDR